MVKGESDYDSRDDISWDTTPLKKYPDILGM